jgi:membrane-associated PAP2 superfamily phosphatase
VWLHVTLMPLCIALGAWLASHTGFDRAVSDAFYDASLARFPAHDSFWLELLGHRIAKAAIWIVAIGMLGAAIGTGRTWPSVEQRYALLVAVFAMALGPTIVYLLKQTTGHHCPWDLKAYGGFADVNLDWFVGAADAGRCFPSGHASAGYSLITLAFLGDATDRPLLARSGLIAAIVIGTAYGAIRVAQGAHFVSHNLWAAAIDWCAAALVFTPLLLRRQQA